MKGSVGSRIRQARTARAFSLSDVASRAEISVATLSRVERDKQGLGVDLLLALARILRIAAAELVGAENGGNVDPLVTRIDGLNHSDRLQLWRDLASERRTGAVSRLRARKLVEQLEELMAQLEFFRSQVEGFKTAVRNQAADIRRAALSRTLPD